MRNVHETASIQLQEKVGHLTERFLRGQQPDFLKQHARALDDYFEQAFETSMIGPRMEINKNPYAIVALGGYGREEQSLHSDVDLLFLFGKRVPAEAENLIREMIYPLWDIGMDVGHATRSIKECLALAANDLNVLTPILDARFICGMSILYSELMLQNQGPEHPQTLRAHSGAVGCLHQETACPIRRFRPSAGAQFEGGAGRAARLPHHALGGAAGNRPAAAP